MKWYSRPSTSVGRGLRVVCEIENRRSGNSPRKVRRVVDLIRGTHVLEAQRRLQFSPLGASRTVSKVLRSAVANAEQKEAHLDVDDLKVKRIVVDKGPQDKRVRPAPMGRAFRVLHRKSHLTIEVSDEA